MSFLVFWLLGLKVGQKPDSPLSKNSIIFKIKKIQGPKSKLTLKVQKISIL
jgi:hypothetical protein